MAQRRKIPRLAATELSESQRQDPILVIYDAVQAANYRFAPYNPDSLIASKGYDELDKLKTMAAYAAPLSVLIAATLYKDWRIVSALTQDAGRKDKAVEIA